MGTQRRKWWNGGRRYFCNLVLDLAQRRRGAEKGKTEVRGRMSDVGGRISDIGHREVRRSDIGYPTSDIGKFGGQGLRGTTVGETRF
jgi:hypothetical protein